jgi:4-aminobutyrate aminotransferase
MFAFQHEGVVPDIVTVAKGLGSGVPIGAVIAKRPIMQRWKKGAHGNTFGGNPLACAAANATLELIETEYAANAAAVGAYFMDRLADLAGRHASIGQVRGRGLMIGMELIEADGAPAAALTQRVITEAYHQGLLLLACGVSTVRFMPPLIIDRGDVDEAMDLLEAALAVALAAPRS